MDASAYECCYFSGRCDHEECGSYGQPEPTQPEPTIEEYCAPHPYDHDDGDGSEGTVGRCYCGAVTYPAGGAPEELVALDR